MVSRLLNERELWFHLYEVLNADAIFDRPRYADHDRNVPVFDMRDAWFETSCILWLLVIFVYR
ncbi:acyl-CoA dehydrogenase N-terminal domain-containing protein [Pseudomonas hefeiensis]|uniref:Acyl-CoA dehydrogenase N-terminal domain-containing protein n=1 Tax=Pseudomonas hefeiensis TaxID=2738125 RepID=A0ABY9GII2_9PSED|nr:MULTISPECIES: acyl-CoA dehydrogenase N-terminal domain-containing protein [unclassified Pseudomonas]WLH15465.1 acyl-CoA dehydrogenase N-terminal domain-containing protein [Pseudomonas sp. FP205]WLH98512.1 acyl-CoA dehydrogenase N-terminal domain-containing protein [Pseudomonas sp. FP53]WLI42773.1 acyl-CoA dehydrogenase N-terminal domain-containing protein [Pseudomonas sp. FP821]